MNTTGTAQSEAGRMLDAFTSVGADRFHLTLTNIREEETEFLRNRTVPSMRYNLPAWMRRSAKLQPITLPATETEPEETILAGENLILRPYTPPAVVLVQLDDLEHQQLERVRQAAFLTLQTSPGNYQAWMAVQGGDREFTSRLKRGTGADLSASGSVRMAGTGNYKRKYKADFPVVRIDEVHLGRIVTREQLESMGLPERARRKPQPSSSPFDVLTGPVAWPGRTGIVAWKKCSRADRSAAPPIFISPVSLSTASNGHRRKPPTGSWKFPARRGKTAMIMR
jgi:RepB DNA-primase from phage plasmid